MTYAIVMNFLLWVTGYITGIAFFTNKVGLAYGGVILSGIMIYLYAKKWMKLRKLIGGEDEKRKREGK